MAPIFPLEEFTTQTVADKPARTMPTEMASNVQAEDVEKARLAGYESGYQAGWDDCVKTELDEQERIGAEFARNLQDLSFTFHEARSHIMQGLEPLFAGILEKILPTLVSNTIGQTLVEELIPLASQAADIPIEIVVPPSARATIEPILLAASTVPFELLEEETLAEGQVFLRTGKTEKHIDLTGAIQRISQAINDLYDLNDKAFQHG